MNKCSFCGDWSDTKDWCSHCNLPVKEISTQSEPSHEPDIYDMAYEEEIDSQGWWIELPDGYTGAKEKFFIVPIEEDDKTVKLRCATDGKKHLIRYATKEQFEKALNEQGIIRS